MFPFGKIIGKFLFFFSLEIFLNFYQPLSTHFFETLSITLMIFVYTQNTYFKDIAIFLKYIDMQIK